MITTSRRQVGCVIILCYLSSAFSRLANASQLAWTDAMFSANADWAWNTTQMQLTNDRRASDITYQWHSFITDSVTVLRYGVLHPLSCKFRTVYQISVFQRRHCHNSAHCSEHFSFHNRFHTSYSILSDFVLLTLWHLRGPCNSFC